MATKNEMKRWLLAATREERERVAHLAGTTVGTIRHVAGGYRTGGEASVGATLARNIEKATRKVAREGLPEVKRGDLCIDCAGCDLYKQSTGSK
jgi:hypothetical protein